MESTKTSEALSRRAGQILSVVREKRPLVHNITNWVVTNVTANALLALGASPVMAHAQEEVEDMVSIASSLVLNIGTLTPYLVEAMIMAGKKANEVGVPVIFDPVGAGATRLRTESAQRILKEVKVDVLRGNPSEVSVVGGFGGAARGVDSAGAGATGERLAVETSRRLGCVVAVTGKTDYVSNGNLLMGVENGHEMLTRVTGMGCSVTAIVAAFIGAVWSEARNDSTQLVMAAASGLAFLGLAAEYAGVLAKGPGSFQPAVLDAIYGLTPEQLEAGARMWQTEIKA